jgi:hypothetical protein
MIAPENAGTAGVVLWESITGAFDLEPHELTVLAQVVKVAGRVAPLDAVVDDQGVLSDDRSGARWRIRRWSSRGSSG